MAGVSFPCDSFREAAPHLRRPFAPNAVKFKVQTGTMVVPYIDARTVVERLNLVVPHLWTDAYEPWSGRPESNKLVCHLTIDGLTRSDVGSGSSNEGEKGAYSDALKRAAVKFGVGVSLYAMKQIFLNSGNGSEDAHGLPTLKPAGRTKQGKDKYAMTPEAERWLRENYAAWLGTDRGRHFGQALDHGDEAGSLGDPAEAPVADEPASTGDGFDIKRAQIEKAWDDLPDKRKLPKGRLTALLNGAESLADLEQIAKQVEEVAGA